MESYELTAEFKCASCPVEKQTDCALGREVDCPREKAAQRKLLAGLESKGLLRHFDSTHGEYMLRKSEHCRDCEVCALLKQMGVVG